MTTDFQWRSTLRRWRLPAALVPLTFAVSVTASPAQTPEEVVQWVASLNAPAGGVKPGSGATIELHADILEGWHVYALTEPSGGPLPLKISLRDGSIARLIGAPSGAAPEQRHDLSFDLDTRFYERALSLSVPIQVKKQSIPGPQVISVDVRFQCCTDRVCLPPKTVSLPVPLTVLRVR